MINEFCTSYNGDKPLFIAADDCPDQTDPIATGVVYHGYFLTFQTIKIVELLMSEIDFNIYNIVIKTLHQLQIGLSITFILMLIMPMIMVAIL